MVIGWFPDLCVGDVARSIAFYRALLGIDVHIEHGWYAELGAHGRVCIAFVQAGHETVPTAVGERPRGVLVSFEVDDARAVAEVARELRCTVVTELVAELGQLHFMVLDPDGAVVDIIERVALTRDDVARMRRLRRDVASIAWE